MVYVPSAAVVVLFPELFPDALTSMFSSATPPAPVTLPLMWTALGSVTLMPVTSVEPTGTAVAAFPSAVYPPLE